MLTALGEGLGTEAVADRLGVSAATVKREVSAAALKLGVRGRTAAVAAALRVKPLV